MSPSPSISAAPNPFDIVPVAIRPLFVKPPVLKSEKLEDYHGLFASLVEIIQPARAMEWLQLKDLVDYCWETLRLRRLKSASVDLERPRALAQVLRRLVANIPNGDATYQTEALAAASIRDPNAGKVVSRLLAENGVDEDCVAAQAFLACVRTLEKIDRMEDAALKRRDKTLQRLEDKSARNATTMPSAAAEAAPVTPVDENAEPADRDRPATATTMPDLATICRSPELLDEFICGKPGSVNDNDPVVRRLLGLHS